MVDRLYYGDNLRVPREDVADESLDLIYLDPPFNSNATYNVLFKAPDGHQSQSQSQIEAFDTWHWTDAAEERRWLGIDITPLAINLIKRRLSEAFGSSARFSVMGLPQDLDGAHALFEQDPMPSSSGPCRSSPTRSPGKAARRAPTPASTGRSICAPASPRATAP